MKFFHALHHSRAVPLIMLAVIFSFVLSGCKGQSSSTTTSRATIPRPEITPVTVFNQTIPVTDNGSSPFPEQANYWDIDKDFSLADGYGNQFDGALKLKVGATDFPSNQDYDELTYYTPTASVVDNVGTYGDLMVASVTDGGNTDAVLISGTYSAVLGSTSDAKMYQILDLSSATAPLMLTWKESVIANLGHMANEPAPTYRVTVRDAAGNLLQTLFSTTASSVVPASHSADLSAYAGRSVILSFERFGSVKGNSVSIDDVSILDGINELITNGDFETGNINVNDPKGWFTNYPIEIQNITSGARTLEGLHVQRTFFTLPSQLWGQWVDVFENDTGSAISKTVTYTTNLGSNGTGIIYGLDENGTVYTSPDPSIKALVSWDGAGNVRDVGIVFAGPSGATLPTIRFTSDDGLGNGNGSGVIEETFSITVPAGDSVAIVHFVVMDAERTFDTATSVSDQATFIDSEVDNAINNFWNDPTYTDGIHTSGTLVNF
jgi:hypothetical protein